ncbi:uncharacterized protein DS421_9g272300 [Arachis hypogaea]|nr:uncharacterized protein DS421_9g272300 [Arachis hypogaea]
MTCVEAQRYEAVSGGAVGLTGGCVFNGGAMATCNRGGGAWATKWSKSRRLLSNGLAALTTVDGSDRRRLHKEEVVRR